MPDLGDPIGIRDRAILEVLYSTAIRRTELTLLDPNDVDYGRMTLLVRGKGQKDRRMVPLSERAKAWLDTYRDQSRPLLVSGRDPGRCFFLRPARRWIEALGSDQRLCRAIRRGQGGLVSYAVTPPQR